MQWKHIGAAGMKVVLLTFVMLVAFLLGAMLSGIGQAAQAASETQVPAASEQQTLAWLLLVSFLEVLVLSYIVLRAQGPRWQVTAALFLAILCLNTVMPAMEAFLYLGQRLGEGFVGGMVIMGLVQAAIFAPAAVWLLGPSPSAAGGREPADVAGPIRPRPDWAWKLPLLAVVYVALYLTFGYYVAWKQPAVREYYGGTDPGRFFLQLASMPAWFFLLHAGRGLLWLFLTLPLICRLAVRRWELPLAVGLLFAVWSFGLLLPNPLMPEAVARTHMVETLLSNFLFGAVVGWVLAQPPASQAWIAAGRSRYTRT